MTILIYLKTCDHCGLKYFGKTIKSKKYCLNKYKGSGKYWKAHIKYHKATITTKIIGVFINEETCKEFCLWYSDTYDIVKNEKYANLICENGLDGGFSMTGKKHNEETKEKMSVIKKGKNNPMYGKNQTKEAKEKISIKTTGENNPMYGKKHTKEARKKISEGKKGKPLSEEHRKKVSEANKGKKHNEETKEKISKANKGKNQAIIKCPYCSKTGGQGNMKRYHFDKCKYADFSAPAYEKTMLKTF